MSANYISSVTLLFIVLNCLSSPVMGQPTQPPKTFGTGKSAFQLNNTEVTILDYNLTQQSLWGVMTHFWITGGPSLGSGTDNATVRYYIDGEETASIEFKPPMATGVGFDDAEVWGVAKAGHGAKDGAWFINYRIPFRKHVKVTVQLPGDNPASCYVIVRGCENLPIDIGSLRLPSTAKLTLHKIERKTFQPLEWVSIVDLPDKSGLIYMTTLAVSSSNKNFLEGCYHLYTPYDQPFPGTVLSTGTEDYFDSAYYFDGGQFHYPVSGYTHINTTQKMVEWSAYRFHEEDPLAFTNGVKLNWRVGDVVNSKTHPESPKCYIDKMGPGDKKAGNPQPSTVTSYAWVYTY